MSVWLQIRDEVAGTLLKEDGLDPVLPHCWRGPHAFRLGPGQLAVHSGGGREVTVMWR